MTFAARVRTVLLVFGAWLTFSAIQLGVSLALAKPGSVARGRALLVDLTMALYWTAMSFPIAAWHRRLRARVRSPWQLISLHLPLLALATLGDTVATRLSMIYLGGFSPTLPFVATVTYFADFDALSYVAVLIAVDALLARAAVRGEERRAAHLESLVARARLDYLEAQLQPHFLFNALGAVSELAYEAPATALRVLRQLAHIFRSALAARSGEVTLGEELIAIEPYLDIQRLRFPDWLRINYDVAGDTLDCLVPRFVLQPLVENAIRHGLTGRVAAGSLEISSRLDAGRVILRVADNGVGLRRVSARAGYGIGLTNVRERLTTLYGAGEQLRLFDAEGGGAVAEVTLPIRRVTDVGPATALLDDPVTTATVEDAERPTAPAPTEQPSWKRGTALAFAIWIGCGLLWTIQSYAYLHIRNRMGQMTLSWVFAYDMSVAIGWALVTPLVFAATSRFPIGRSWLPLRLLAYLGGMSAIVVLHAFLILRIFTPKTHLWSAANTNTFVLNFLVITVLVGWGHRRQLAHWINERALAAEVLTRELRTARERAARLRSIPPVVLNALDRAIDAVSVDPSPRRTEQLLARLADYLRVAIECSDDEGLTDSRQQSLARSLAHFERAARAPRSATPSSLTPS